MAINSFELIIERESGLPRDIGPVTWLWMAIGGGISMGLIQGETLARYLAGPWVWLCYLMAAGVTGLLVLALRDIALQGTPASGFAGYVEAQLGGYAGFVVRMSYFCAFLLLLGSELVLLGHYLAVILGAASWLWSLLLLVLMSLVQYLGTCSFARLLSGFNFFKLMILLAFISIGLWLVCSGGASVAGPDWHFPQEDWPWLSLAGAFLLALFSFQGVELLSLTAAQAQEPAQTLASRLGKGAGLAIALYLLTMLVSVWLVPWQSAPTREAPLLGLMRMAQIDDAKRIFDVFLVLFSLGVWYVQLHVASRLLFSLARAGMAPARLGRLDGRGTPALAVLVTAGLVLIIFLLSRHWPAELELLVIGVAGTGILLSWACVFAARSTPTVWREEGMLAGCRGLAGLALLIIALVLMPVSGLYENSLWLGVLFQVIICCIYFFVNPRRFFISFQWR